jgi:hypothetical protein
VLVLLLVFVNFSNGQKVFAQLSVSLSKEIFPNISFMAGAVLWSDAFGSSYDHT